MSGRYPGPAAFGAALRAKLHDAPARGRSFSQREREFLLQRFLARVFLDEPDRWVLKGGVALLARSPGLRYSKDADLWFRDGDAGDSVAAVRALCGQSPHDPFLFDITKVTPLAGVEGAGVTVTAWLGGKPLPTFTVDMVTGAAPAGEVERLAPAPVVQIDDVAPLPEFVLYPLADHIADKVSAMYEERPGERVSTRYKDLADLVLVVSRWELDAGKLAAALAAAREVKGVRLPDAMRSPGPGWDTRYAQLARTVDAITDGSRSLAGALAQVGRCLDPVLSGRISAGTWNPATTEWENSAAELRGVWAGGSESARLAGAGFDRVLGTHGQDGGQELPDEPEPPARRRSARRRGRTGAEKDHGRETGY